MCNILQPPITALLSPCLDVDRTAILTKIVLGECLNDGRRDFSAAGRGRLNRVAEKMSPGEPLFILDDGRPELPGCIWMAEFESEDCVKDDEYDEEDEDFLGSRLFVCWFSDGIPDTPNADIQAILEAADWPKNARTFLNKA